MGWAGAVLGSIAGHPLGLFGSLMGAFVGHKVEQILRGQTKRGRPNAVYERMSERQRSMVFCASAAAMLAKMAKADGRVTRDEIDAVEAAFRRLGFSPAARAFAINEFRKAKDDSHTIYEYARDFARVVQSLEMRELFYEILWEIATTDGCVSAAERNILERIPMALGIRPEWFGYFAHGGGRGSRSEGPQDDLAAAYAVLNASSRDSDGDIRRKFRELAKANHPDVLRAQGLPEAMIGKATERMSRINAAWETVKRKRGL